MSHIPDEQQSDSDAVPAPHGPNHTVRYLVVSRGGETLLGAGGTLYYADSLPDTALAEASLDPKIPGPATEGAHYRAAYVEDADLVALAAQLAARDEQVSVSTAGFRFYPVHADTAGRARYAAALAKRDYLLEMGYSAYTGEDAPIDERKGIRMTAQKELVFPRIEPAVMALIVSEDGHRVLLANNRQWEPNRFALVAGFVDPGENLEEAVSREVYEEVGLTALGVQYRMSDVWPFPRSLMICYRVRVDATQPVVHLDGEIASARWFNPGQLRAALDEQVHPENHPVTEPALQLPGTNTVARRMLEEWLDDR